jgi:hypothetical protein
MKDYYLSENHGMSKGELAGILTACGCLVFIQWVLSHWQITLPVFSVWINIFTDPNGFWVFSLAGINFVACFLAKNKKSLNTILILGILIFILSFLIQTNLDFVRRILISLKWYGMYGISVVLYQSYRSRDMRILMTVTCFSIFVPISSAFLFSTYILKPQTVDIYAYNFDLSLNWRIAPYLFTLYRKSLLVSSIGLVAYIALLAAFQLLFALQTRVEDRTVVPALRFFLIAAILGYTSYFIFPAVGPIYIFGDHYPYSVPALPLMRTYAPAAARNSMPSLHFAWALLLWINIPRKLKYARALFALYSFLMVIATLGSGEHYFVDLVAALPFVCLVQAIGLCITNGFRRRHVFSIIRSALVFLTFVSLIFFTPVLLQRTSLARVITIFLIVIFFLENRSQRAESCRQVSVRSESNTL